MTAGATDACHDEEPFPFMKLPPELRLMVYQCALQDITDPIMFPPSDEAQKPHPCRGALALVQTSKYIREESYRPMWRIALRHTKSLSNAFRAALERNSELRNSTHFGSPAYEQASDERRRAYRRTTCMNVITSALERAMNASHADRSAQYKKGTATCDSSPHHQAAGQAQ